MSFVAAATAIGLEGVAANVAAGAMMGGAVKVGTNVVTGQDPFKDIGKSILMGGLTGGLTPGVSEAFGVSMPMAAGITQGGLTALATGDLSKGLMAGMGAYGSYGLAENFGGGNVRGEQVFGDTQAAEGSLGDKFNKYLTDPEGTSKPFTAPGSGTGNFFKDNWKYAAALAAPIMADQAAKSNMPQTVTQPGMIRPYTYDPYSGGFTAGNPYEAQVKKAASGGIMGFDESANSPMSRQSLGNMQDTGGMFNYAHDGGVVMKMAEGGLSSIVRMANGTPPEMLSDEALYQKTGSWEAAAAARDAQNNALNQYNWAQQAAQAAAPIVQAAAPAPQAQALQTATTSTTAPAPVVPDASDWWASQPGGVNAMYDYINNQLNTTFKNATDAQIDAAMKQYGISNEDVHNALQKGGGSKAEEYSLLAGNMGLSGLNQNINDWISKANADPRFKNLTPEQKRAEAIAAMGTVNMNEADVLRATGKTIAELFPKVLTCPPGYHKSADGLSCEKDTVVPGNFTEVPVTLFPGAGGGGNTVVNANGTITTGPNIPGIPKDGFTGMGQVRDVYTQGGGSLGYTSPTYTSLKAVEDKYPLTGGSAEAYNYLTGKTKYSPTPWTSTGEVMKPYAESVLGIPTSSSKKMYIFDPATKQYKINPDYAIPTYDKDGKKSYNLTNADVKAFVSKAPSASDFYTWATTNNLSPEQIATASERPITEITKLFSGGQKLAGDDGKIDQTKVDAATADDIKTNWDETAYLAAHPDVANELKTGKSVSGQPVQFTSGYEHWLKYGKDSGVQPITKKAEGGLAALTMARGGMAHQPFFSKSSGKFNMRAPQVYADGGMADHYNLGGYSDGGRLLRGPGDGVSDSIPATIGNKQPARLADGEFVVPARIVSELGNGSTEAGARKLYAMMDRVQAARKGSIGKGKVAKNSRADKYLPA